MFKKTEEEMDQMDKSTDIFNRKLESIKEYQMDILELKNTISDILSSLDSLNIG